VDYPGTHLPDYPETKQFILPVLQALVGSMGTALLSS
jgi:hypothetical protein